MTKQEVIKEAWENLGISVNDNVISQDGWMNIKPTQYERLYDRVNILRLTAHVHRIRPKSLNGIENNNGWIKIESEADLPDKRVDCFFWDKKDGLIIGEFLPECAAFVLENATHYQPIIKPEPPIY